MNLTELLTTADVARALGVSPSLVDRLERRGDLPSIRTRTNRFRLYRPEDVARLGAARAARKREPQS